MVIGIPMAGDVAFMKKVAIFIPTIHPGGAEKQACLLAKGLSARGYPVSFIIMYGLLDVEPKNLEILNSNPGINIILLPPEKFGKVTRLINILRNEKFDILFNYLTMCDVVGGLCGKICGVGRIYGGIRNSRLPSWKLIPEWFTHHFISSKTIYNCYSGADYFKSKGFCSKKNIIIHNCIDTISPLYVRPKSEKPGIISVGRFVEQKDYYTALQVIKKLKENCLNFSYTIVGYGVLEASVRKWIKEFGLENYIEIFIAPCNIPELLQRSDIYLSTSLFEGTCNTLLEALNACLPIVATDVGDCKYIVKNGINGYIHSVGDVNSMVLSLELLIKDSVLRNKFGEEGHSILRRNFNIGKFVSNYIKIVEDL